MREHTKPIIVATWIGIIVHVLLTIIKGIVGIISGSRDLIADALHSASNIAGYIVALVPVRTANKPTDKEKPYGHGKAENIASIIVALLLVIVAIEIIFSSFK